MSAGGKLVKVGVVLTLFVTIPIVLLFIAVLAVMVG